MRSIQLLTIKIAVITISFILPACNLHQEIEQAIEARKKSDSILQEFKRVNAELDSENKRLKVKIKTIMYYDSAYFTDSIDLPKTLETLKQAISRQNNLPPDHTPSAPVR